MPSASSTSAPSTQPPVTVPSIRPRSSTSSSAPGSSGAEPIASTSVAATTRRPCSSHRSAMSIDRGTTPDRLRRQRCLLVLDQVAVPAAVAGARVGVVRAKTAAARRRAARRAPAGQRERRAVARFEDGADRAQMEIDDPEHAPLRGQGEAPADLGEERLRGMGEVVTVAHEPLHGRLACAQHALAVVLCGDVAGEVAVDRTAEVVHDGALVIGLQRGATSDGWPAEPRGQLRRDRLEEEKGKACSSRTDKSKTYLV